MYGRELADNVNPGENKLKKLKAGRACLDIKQLGVKGVVMQSMTKAGRDHDAPPDGIA